MYLPHFFIHSFIDGHLGCFHVLAINAAINLRVQTFLQVNVFIFCRQIPKWNFWLSSLLYCLKTTAQIKEGNVDQMWYFTMSDNDHRVNRSLASALGNFLSLGHITSLGCGHLPWLLPLFTVGVRVSLNRALPPAKNRCSVASVMQS